MKYIVLVFALVLTQALFFGGIHVFGIATPMIHLYFVVQMQRNMPRWLSMVLSFVVGLLVDMFASTPGMAAASMTLIAFVQPFILNLYLHNADEIDFQPSLRTMGMEKYATYVTFLTVIYCTAFFTLEAFSFHHWRLWILCIIGSTLFTVIPVIIVSLLADRNLR